MKPDPIRLGWYSCRYKQCPVSRVPFRGRRGEAITCQVCFKPAKRLIKLNHQDVKTGYLNFHLLQMAALPDVPFSDNEFFQTE
jgi:hypothetical protein